MGGLRRLRATVTTSLGTWGHAAPLLLANGRREGTGLPHCCRLHLAGRGFSPISRTAERLTALPGTRLVTTAVTLIPKGGICMDTGLADSFIQGEFVGHTEMSFDTGGKGPSTRLHIAVATSAGFPRAVSLLVSLHSIVAPPLGLVEGLAVLFLACPALLPILSSLTPITWIARRLETVVGAPVVSLGPLPSPRRLVVFLLSSGCAMPQTGLVRSSAIAIAALAVTGALSALAATPRQARGVGPPASGRGAVLRGMPTSRRVKPTKLTLLQVEPCQSAAHWTHTVPKFGGGVGRLGLSTLAAGTELEMSATSLTSQFAGPPSGLGRAPAKFSLAAHHRLALPSHRPRPKATLTDRLAPRRQQSPTRRPAKRGTPSTPAFPPLVD